MLRARAIENQCYCIGVNRVGADGRGLAYLGGSAVHDYLGDPMTDCGDRPGVAHAVLSRDGLRNFRREYPFHLDADPFDLTH